MGKGISGVRLKTSAHHRKYSLVQIWGCSKVTNYRHTELEINKFSASVSVSAAFVFELLYTPGQETNEMGGGRHRARFMLSKCSPVRARAERCRARWGRGRAGCALRAGAAGRWRGRAGPGGGPGASPPPGRHGSCRGGGASRWPAGVAARAHHLPAINPPFFLPICAGKREENIKWKYIIKKNTYSF